MFEQKAENRLLGDIMPSLAESHAFARHAAHEELRYLIDRRDKLTDRIRFGLLALNGASLVALIGALGGGGNAAQWLGFTHNNSIFSAAAFTFGLALAGWSVVAQQSAFVREAGDGSARAQTLNRLASLYKLPATKENVERMSETMNELNDLPLTGFQFQHRSIFAQNFSAGAWFAGIALPFMTALGLG
ncbi:MAG TPA: hypothetical protein VI381_07900 [Allosphingosinicella sp.]